MVSSARLVTNVSLLLIITTLVFHLVAMGYPRWKVYEHRAEPSKLMNIGIFDRCEHVLSNFSNFQKTYVVCDALLYLKNDSCCRQLKEDLAKRERHRMCNLDEHRNVCDYSPIGKSLISSTIIAACTIGLAFLLTFSHLFIGEFKYKIHLAISAVSILLLLLGFIFLLATMIIVGSSMAYDLHQYEYNMDCLVAANTSSQAEIRRMIYDQSANDYVVRLDWAGAMEIIALIVSSFALLSQILYLFWTYRNQIG